MRKALSVVGLIGLLGAGTALAVASEPTSNNGRPANGGTVYVSSQGLYYQTFVARNPLPGEGPFQLLEAGGPNGTNQTEFGPGDAGYLGGRWKTDFDGDGVFDYFVCPLIGPGRETF